MTLMHRTLRTYAMAGMMALYATAASSQMPSEPKAHSHQNHAAPPSQGAAVDAKDARHDSMARMALLDQRIEMLTADMNMFVGDAKVRIMAELLTALVERQTGMRDEMRRSGSAMKGRMMERSETPADPGDGPEKMCAPSP